MIYQYTVVDVDASGDHDVIVLSCDHTYSKEDFIELVRRLEKEVFHEMIDTKPMSIDSYIVRAAVVDRLIEDYHFWVPQTSCYYINSDSYSYRNPEGTYRL